MKRGKFITVEGTEGVGKTTNIEFITHYLTGQGIELVVSREPGGTPMAEEIRQLLLATREEIVDSKAELLLMFAARAQHLNQLILPALDAGKWVLCDRFTDATYAYQGGGRGLGLDTIAQLETLVQGSLRPDLTLILDIDVKAGLARAKQRGQLDRFEGEKAIFFDKVRNTYLTRAAQAPDQYRIVNAGQQLGCVQSDVQTILASLI